VGSRVQEDVAPEEGIVNDIRVRIGVSLIRLTDMHIDRDLSVLCNLGLRAWWRCNHGVSCWHVDIFLDRSSVTPGADCATCRTGRRRKKGRTQT
jgi:hypothetical protein